MSACWWNTGIRFAKRFPRLVGLQVEGIDFFLTIKAL